MNTSRFGEGGGPGTAGAAVAQGVVLVKSGELHERRADQALWLLNRMNVPLTLRDFGDMPYVVLDIMTAPAANSSHNGSTVASAAASGSGMRSQYSLGHSHHRGSPLRMDRQHHQPPPSNVSSNDMMLLTESLDRKYKFTEDTVFWTIDHTYNVVFVIDMSQSMYSVDPNTNNVHIQTALDTLEKCLGGMIQPFTVHCALGMPDYD
ncbi:hypothetical protein GGF42_008956, partial [Coemansia sp. RSA 2424]